LGHPLFSNHSKQLARVTACVILSPSQWVREFLEGKCNAMLESDSSYLQQKCGQNQHII